MEDQRLSVLGAGDLDFETPARPRAVMTGGQGSDSSARSSALARVRWLASTRCGSRSEARGDYWCGRSTGSAAKLWLTGINSTTFTLTCSGCEVTHSTAAAMSSGPSGVVPE